jgi:hypothetical protein
MSRNLKRNLALAIFPIAFTSGGCTITQTANPVAGMSPDVAEICVIENPAVNKEFLPAFQDSLSGKGFRVHLVEAASQVSACPLTTTYVGQWSWDFVPYMAYGYIVVYQDGIWVGDALYRSPRAGWSMTPRIYKSTKGKVATMVDQLFPSRP